MTMSKFGHVPCSLQKKAQLLGVRVQNATVLLKKLKG